MNVFSGVLEMTFFFYPKAYNSLSVTCTYKTNDKLSNALRFAKMSLVFKPI